MREVTAVSLILRGHLSLWVPQTTGRLNFRRFMNTLQFSYSFLLQILAIYSSTKQPFSWKKKYPVSSHWHIWTTGLVTLLSKAVVILTQVLQCCASQSDNHGNCLVTGAQARYTAWMHWTKVGEIHLLSEPGVSTVRGSHEIHNGTYSETYIISRISHLIFSECG